jgi:hypothetical protein
LEGILGWILTLIGLIGGIIAGFGINWFFHKKSLKVAKEEAHKERQRSQGLQADILKLQTEIESLKARLEKLNQNVLSRRRESNHPSKQNERSITDAEFYDEAQRCCDSDGTIPKARLVGHFKKEMTKKQIDDRIKQFVEQRRFTIDDNQKIGLI